MDQEGRGKPFRVRHEEGRAYSLHRPRSDQQFGALRKATPHRGQGEEHDAGREHTPSSKVVAQGPSDQDQGRQEERVGRHHPLGVYRRSVQAGLYGWQSHEEAVSSMKAMLDPSMVAANTHGAAFGVQADCTSIERITCSSQGCLITLAKGPPVRATGAGGRRGSVHHGAFHSRHGTGRWHVDVPRPYSASSATRRSNITFPDTAGKSPKWRILRVLFHGGW